MKIRVAAEGPDTPSIPSTERGRELCRQVMRVAATRLAEHIAVEHADGLLHGACGVCVALDNAMISVDWSLKREMKKRAA